VYSHLRYDVQADEQVVVRQPDVLIVEGLNVLQTGTAPTAMPCSSPTTSTSRSTSMRTRRTSDAGTSSASARCARTAFADPRSYFHRYADLSDAEADATAGLIWDTINGPNLVENILPTRSRADLILRKGPDHLVDHVRLRRL
jgi:type I pantothenate kinase